MLFYKAMHLVPVIMLLASNYLLRRPATIIMKKCHNLLIMVRNVQPPTPSSNPPPPPPSSLPIDISPDIDGTRRGVNQDNWEAYWMHQTKTSKACCGGSLTQQILHVTEWNMIFEQPLPTGLRPGDPKWEFATPCLDGALLEKSLPGQGEMAAMQPFHHGSGRKISYSFFWNPRWLSPDNWPAINIDSAFSVKEVLKWEFSVLKVKVIN